MLKLVTFREPVPLGFRKSAGGIRDTYEAGTPYLFSHSQINNVMREQKIRDNVYKLSSVAPRIQNFHVEALKPGQRVLLYNASGGYGDQILTWPVANLLHSSGAQVHILTEVGNNMCWWNLPFVRSINTVPIRWETVKLFEHCAFFDYVVNVDEHQDQEHPVDVMLRRIGFDPDVITPSWKVVKPSFTSGELAAFEQYHGRSIGLYQLSSANPVRSLPAGDSVHILCSLAEAFPKVHWLGLYDDFIPKAYPDTLQVEVAKRKLTNVEGLQAPNLRELWALASRAAVVVGPDSMMIHVAGSLEVPCVGLWGPIAPSKRVAYYKNHSPIFPKDACPHAPCFSFFGKFPPYCEPLPVERTVCSVLAAIKADQVIRAVQRIV